MRKLRILTKIQGKLQARTPDSIIFGIGMPVFVLLLVAMVAGDKQAGTMGYTFLDSSFASLLVVGICATAFMGIPLTVCDYRDKKIFKHFFVTPVSPIVLLVVQILIAALTAIFSALIVWIVGTVFLGYRMQGNGLLLIGAYFLVLISMYGLGLLIGSLCKNLKIANLVCTFVYFPMLFLSGAVIPFELFPEGVQKVAAILPLTQGIKLLKIISLNEPINNPMIISGYLALLGLVTFGLSVKWFRWD